MESDTRQVLVFGILNEELAFDISCVREVLRVQGIHPLPQSPDFIKGVTSVRNRVIVVIDLRKKFNMKPMEDRSQARIIVCKLQKFIVGLVVDRVSEVLTLARREIQPVPEIAYMQKEAVFILGIARVGERVITIIDLEKILTSDELASLSNIKK